LTGVAYMLCLDTFGGHMSVWRSIGALVNSIGEGGRGLAHSVAAAFDPDNWLPGGRDAAFTLALVALSAKMAVADGIVVNSEIRAFRSMVEIPSGSEAQVERFFDLAQQDVAGYQSYARKIGKLFSDQPQMLEHVLNGLFQIAGADGMVHEAELAYLKSVSDIFGFDEERFAQISAQHLGEMDGADPFLVLGLTSAAPDDEVRRTYRALVREHHPDRLTALGVPSEMIGFATARMAAINAAFDEISRLRGLV
jgi:DnaJ like chaperone protein